MYELLKKLRTHNNILDEVIGFMTPFVLEESLHLTDKDIVSVKEIFEKLIQTDVFLLLEAIFFSANNFHENLIKELEEKYTEMIRKILT